MLIDNIKNLIPDIGISQDMITGFPTETEEDHQGTLDLIDYVKYDYGFMFYYSERPGTLAERKMEDDIPLEIKKRRLQDVIDLQREISRKNLLRYQDQTIEVLIEKESKKNKDEWSGRNDQNVVAVFPKGDYKVGDFVNVKVNECTTGTLIGEAVGYADYWQN